MSATIQIAPSSRRSAGATDKAVCGMQMLVAVFRTAWPRQRAFAISFILFLVWANPLFGLDDENRDAVHPRNTGPNFLIILADDLGWSDIGAFGSEIRTPHIDALASQGMAMTQFYVAPVCAPTRSMLLTGVDNHLAGVGTLEGLQAPNQVNSRNYVGQLHEDVVTLAEGLRSAGYRSYMTGKWHLAIDTEQQPHRRGFDRSYALLQGGASHFADRRSLAKGGKVDYLEDGRPVELPQDFYSSIAYTDKLLEYLGGRPHGSPFFAYLAYTAPHDPLQVPDAWLHRYQGHYDEGPVHTRERRASALRNSGLFPDSAKLWEHSGYPPWLPLYRQPWLDRPSHQRTQDARAMEIYAAMIELMDQQIGRVISYLNATGELDNTYILFLSDNGASGTAPLVYPGNTRDWFLGNHDLSLENMGKPGSYTFLDYEWATVAVTPWKLYKTTVGDGGIRSPFIVTGPGIPPETINASIAHVTDIVPTLYALAGASPERDELYEGKILPQGRSLAPQWTQAVDIDHHPIVTEFGGSRAVRNDNWKASNILPPMGSGEWELYDMLSDPGEVADVSGEYPMILGGLVKSYDTYVKTNGVIFPEPLMERDISKLYAGECNWWCEFRFELTHHLFRLFQWLREGLQL